MADNLSCVMLKSDDFLLGITTIDADPALNHRERERKAVLQLLRQMLHDDEVTISHNADGKPTIPGYHISLSHTRGYAAVILSKTRPVGVDIEYRSNRVERIAQRFLRPDELDMFHAHSSTSAADWCSLLLMAWCAKEAVYKYFSEDHLAYADMRCTIADTTRFDVENLKRSKSVSVAFQLTDTYVLSWVE